MTNSVCIQELCLIPYASGGEICTWCYLMKLMGNFIIVRYVKNIYNI